MNDAKYTLPENQEKEWISGVLIDKPQLNLDLINEPAYSRGSKRPVQTPHVAPASTVLFPNPYGIKKTLNGHAITPSTLTAASLGFKLEPLKGSSKQAKVAQSAQKKDVETESQLERLLYGASVKQKEMIMKLKEGKGALTKEQIVMELAKGDLSSDDELEGRSVHQEVDYSNTKRAMKEIKKANLE